MARRRKDWMAEPDAAVTFSRFCAPTALAALLGVPRIETAELLLEAGIAHRSAVGCVCTVSWNRYMIHELGLVRAVTARPMAERKALVAERRAKGGWKDGETHRSTYRTDRWGWEREVIKEGPSVYDRTVRYPTVAQWLKANPTASGILNVEGHTLAIRDGQVIGDTLRTKSMRRRVESAFLEGA